MYERMIESRYLDDAVHAAYFEGKTPVFDMAKGPVPGEMHQSFGQEPCAVGVLAYLGKGDVVGAAHRPHHVAVARGVNLKRCAGAAMSRRMQGLPGIAVAYIGEAAANQGAFHEVMNMASLWKLPFICVIEEWRVRAQAHLDGRGAQPNR